MKTVEDGRGGEKKSSKYTAKRKEGERRKEEERIEKTCEGNHFC